jgi:hypothetical protein
MRITFKGYNIIVLILHFLIHLGTRQDPSQFEFTSTAPAVLTTAQPTQPTPAAYTAVASFMESLSTT